MSERSSRSGLPPDASSVPASDDESGAPRAESDAALGRRAQILATEHWGLLAARSTAQSEVLTRITIFLALVSAGLVTIGLLGQASRFGGWFGGASLGILGFLSVIGFMTQVRVMNVSEEDMMYVVAMNRIRTAYVDLDPQVADVFLASFYDDMAGMKRTYSFLRPRGASVLLGSSALLLIVVNACVVGLLVGSATIAAGGGFDWAMRLAVTAGVLFSAGFVVFGGFGYRWAWAHYVPRRPTPPAAGEARPPKTESASGARD
ncbi:hypothetical protein [Microbacterium sp. SD291]|uniref:hypothetical protein n=1 Tax=Microbacterium sp. SD291 TaxID=2782007 RepID=UPI001A95F462|nr:hypothetical protein [Microbacterium sp. SD291]MBO0980393.1 hypothetical protein [Microbacterium sp. SD291]